MRHLDIVVPQRWFITEAKARIDHPEDLVFDEGTSGAKKALAAIKRCLVFIEISLN